MNNIFSVNWEGEITQENLTILNQTIDDKYPDIQRNMEYFSKMEFEIRKETNLVDSYKLLNDSKVMKELEKMPYVKITKDEVNIDAAKS